MAATNTDRPPATDLDSPEWRQWLAFRDESEAAKPQPRDSQTDWHTAPDHHKEWR